MEEHLKSLKLLEVVKDDQFATAQKWWWYTRIAQFLGLLLSLGLFIDGLSDLTLVVISFAVVSFFIELRYDYLWKKSQALLRVYEYWDGLDWQPSNHYLSTLQANMPNKLRSQLSIGNESNKGYFDSIDVPSMRRLVTNLQQSSWYTWQLAKTHLQIFSLITTIVSIIAISMLYISLEVGVNQTTGQTVARVTGTIYAFLFTGGFVRLIIDYLELLQEAKSINQAARNLISREAFEVSEGLTLYIDYQFVREHSPPLLKVIWERREQILNESWEHYNKID